LRESAGAEAGVATKAIIMFSGLTNQFTSLVGAVKGGAGDEDVPAPTGEAVLVKYKKRKSVDVNRVLRT